MATAKKPITPRGVTKKDKALGERVRMRRLAIGLSQADLGEKLGVSFQQVQKYEKGVNRVGSVRLEAIAEALDCSVMSILTGDDWNCHGDSTPFTKFMSTKEGVQIVEAMIAIDSHEVRRSIISLAESLRAS